MNRLKNISPEGRSIGYRKTNQGGQETKFIITLVNQVTIVEGNKEEDNVEQTFRTGDIIKLYSFAKTLNFAEIEEFAQSNNITNYSINGNTITMNWSKSGNLMIRESWVENDSKVYQWRVNSITDKDKVVPLKDNKEMVTAGVYELTSTGNTTVMRRKPDYISTPNFIRMCSVLRRGNLCRSTLVFINDVIFDQPGTPNPGS